MKHDAMIGVKPALVDFTTYEESVPLAMDAAGARRVLEGADKVLLKPNLVNNSRFPVTTAPEFVDAVIAYVKAHSKAAVVIAEGCGEPMIETGEIFAELGYEALAAKYGIALLDLNHAPLTTLENPDCPVFPKMHLPEVLFDHLVISLPVLKAHSLARFTGSLKNMMGCAPPEHYAGRGGFWRKAVFHQNMQQSLIDLASYRAPDFTVMDATVGLPTFHLGGAPCAPPVNRILAGPDPWEADREACSLLGIDWRDVEHVARRP